MIKQKKPGGCNLSGFIPLRCGGQRMRSVHDTESFIQKARSVHGDRYDYSLTEWNGSQKPITIVCRVCGPFNLSSAGSHYKKQRPCGCGKCNYGLYAGRKICACGEEINYHNKRIQSASETCRTCYERDRDAREFEQKKRTCKRCGNWYVRSSKGNRVCIQCNEAFERKKKRERSVSCVNCKTVFIRSKQKIERNDRHFCSLECYQKSKAAIVYLPIVQLYRCELCGSVSHRKHCRADGCWSGTISRALTEFKSKQKSANKQRTKEEEWKYRIQTRCSSNKGRKARGKPQEPRGYDVYYAVNYLLSLEERTEEWEWLYKISNKESNARKRIRRKNEIQRQSESDLFKAQERKLQMCFEWD